MPATMLPMHVLHLFLQPLGPLLVLTSISRHVFSQNSCKFRLVALLHSPFGHQSVILNMTFTEFDNAAWRLQSLYLQLHSTIYESIQNTSKRSKVTLAKHAKTLKLLLTFRCPCHHTALSVCLESSHHASTIRRQCLAKQQTKQFQIRWRLYEHHW